ncbi:ankyrin repeat domain-containing protein [Paenibacillus chungangensis]|uniref:Ankyrin repeat domain-containing protein n=1 Tax=Paenibacillus chungangensis TaxID=696535 RepID=A0ABW3HVW0_9BACL
MNFTYPCGRGHTSVHTAAFHDDNVALIKLLLEHGADVDAKVEDGNDAVSLAKERGNLRVAELLESRFEN